MSTRANIELYDGWRDTSGSEDRIEWRKGALLYHHHYHHDEGYLSWMGPELARKLQAAEEALDTVGHADWWDSERVAALVVKLSADGDGIPAFQPCAELHRDIEYLWRVFLTARSGYRIRCFRVRWDWERSGTRGLEEEDWRAAL